jgi:hypothetical protein
MCLQVPGTCWKSTHKHKIPTDKTKRANTRRQTQEHKSSIDERYKKKKKRKTKKNKNQTLTLRIEESKYGRVVTVMQQQVLGSSSGRELEAAFVPRILSATTPAGESTP